MNEIEMFRGDTLLIPVVIRKNNEPSQLQENQNLIFSLKKFSGDDEYILQKSLNKGITWDNQTQRYTIRIEHEDTKDMKLNYESKVFQYDVTIILGNFVRTIRGTLKIKRDITRNENIAEPPEDTGLTDEQINAINSIVIDIDDELSIEYNENVLDLNFIIEGGDLIVDNNVNGLGLNINEDGELEVLY